MKELMALGLLGFLALVGWVFDAWLASFVALLTAVIVVVSRDLLPGVSSWLGRRADLQGRDGSSCADAIRTIAQRWLVHPPRMSHTDQSRLLIMDDIATLRGNALSCSWPYAFLAKGLLMAYEASPRPTELDALCSYANRMADEQGCLRMPLVSVDQTTNGELLMGLAKHVSNDRYQGAADSMVDYLLQRCRNEGTLSYRLSADWRPLKFVDTVGMVCPLLAQYGALHHVPEATKLAVHHIEEFIRYGVEPRTDLPFHGYNTDAGNAPFGVVGWGRGVGWFCLGLIDTVRWLEADDPTRASLEATVHATADALLRFQCADGGWGCLVAAPSQFDSSATAMFGYFLARGLEAGILDMHVLPSIGRALSRLKKATRASGIVDFAQGDTMGIGSHSRVFRPGPHVQGLALAFMVIASRLPSEIEGEI